MISGLSAQILGHIEKHPGGVKLVELQSEFRRPPQEIEAAVSQLKRQNYIQQSQLGIWTVCKAGPVRAESEPQHARIVPMSATAAKPEPQIPNVSKTEHAEEPAMPKGTKKCDKCGARKGATAYHAGSDTCRACQSGKPKSKSNDFADQRLKEILKRQSERVAATDEGDAIEAAIAALESRRHKIDEAISTLRALG